jgi:hypothetical protein
LRNQALWIGLVLCIIVQGILNFTSDVTGNNASFHLSWIEGFDRVLRDGILVPRWIPSGFYGYGSPAFYFYPPLTYYISSFFGWIFQSHDSIFLFKNTALFASVLSGFTAHYFARTIGLGSRQALAAAIFYVVSPVRVFELYIGSALSQHVGYVFLPLILAGIYRTINEQCLQLNLLLAISWGLLMLSGVPITLVTIVALIVFGVIYRKRIHYKAFLSIGLSILLGSSLAAFHYLPIPYFQKFVHTESLWLVGSTRRHPGNWIPALIQGTQFNFVVQALLIFLTHIAIVTYFLKKRNNDADFMLRFAATFSIFMLIIETPYLSFPIWYYVPPFPLIQFHYRFAILTTIVVISTLFSNRREAFFQRILLLWVYMGLLLSFVLVFNIRRTPPYVNPWKDPTEYLPSSSPSPDIVMGKLFTQNDSAHTSVTLTGTESIQLVIDKSNRKEFHISLQSPKQIILHQFIWPQWKAYVQGKLISITPDSLGRATVFLDSGQYTLHMNLEDAPIERTGNVVSIAGIAVIVGFALRPLLNSRRNGK